MVRLGMLGSGFIADFYLAGLRDVPEARVTAAYSRSAARAADFARRHGVARTYDDVDALCADPDVDLVVVCLPNHCHLEAVRAAATAGKTTHLMVSWCHAPARPAPAGTLDFSPLWSDS